VKLLLDTHALIWFAANDPRLSPTARAVIENPAHEAFYSAASIWEIAIKSSLGKLKLTRALDDAFRAALESNGFQFLPVQFLHAANVAALPLHHGDPFDRLLISQALIEGLHPVSNDTAFDRYPMQRIW
jgi:PIN domain nuclease of toxin-antitoxin system